MSYVPTISLPFKGYWVSLNSPGHHKYAFDFIASVPGNKPDYYSKSHLQTFFGSVKAQTWVGWSLPVLSPFNGTIVEASDGWPDKNSVSLLYDIGKLLLNRPKIINNDVRPFAGNYVVIESKGIYAFLAHMCCGSIKVKIGQNVVAGEQIGEVGHSGFTLAPHIHFQLMAEHDLIKPKIIPFKVEQYELFKNNRWQLVQNDILTKSILIRTV